MKLLARLVSQHTLLSMGAFALSAVLSPAFAQNPTQPGNLRYAVYSNKSAEVFWNRSTDDALVVAYEIAINDQVVKTLDGTSFYSSTYLAGNDYTISVTAIDNELNRSEPASIQFVSGVNRSVEQPKDEDSDVTAIAPAAPTNVRAAIYSRKTFELFWDRVQDDVLSYEVFVDSELVNYTFGTSSTQRNLIPGTQYSASVVAIDANGNRSDDTTIVITMPGKQASGSGTDAGAVDAGTTDSGSDDAGTTDSGADDAGSTDSGSDDAGTTDSGVDDAGTTDSGTDDAGTTDSGSDDAGNTDSGTDDTGTTDSGSNDAGTTDSGTTDGGMISAFKPDDSDIVDVDDFYDLDGYDTVDVIRVDVRTQTVAGTCTIDDQSGCTLDDVKADVDPDDDFKVEIAVKFQADDFPDDGSESNATLRQRGGTSRSFPQKSFRVKLDSKKDLWRSERRLQLNKHPNERARIRNKLSFDLMRGLPHLPSLRTQFVNLWIDDGEGPEDHGLFTHVEYVGKEYLVNRGLNEDDRVYKIEFFKFSQGDLDNIQVDENGEPLDDDRFESRLDPKRGDDHTDVVKMLEAFVDPDQSFESVLEKHFNRNNVLTWIAANSLLYQTDAVTHNYYLYNPLGTEKFYFLPWDYDGAFYEEATLTNSYDNDALAKRLYYGYARGVRSDFISQLYKLPGIHEEIVAVADELRNSYLTDSNIHERAVRYSQVIDPYMVRSPDIDDNAKYNITSTAVFADRVARNHEALRTRFDIPMPHDQQDPIVSNGKVDFSWTPAFDVTRTNTLSYDLEVASSVDFNPDSVVLSVEGIEDDSDLISHTVGISQLPSGTLFYRVTARGDSNPTDVWQVSLNELNRDGQTWFGVVEFDLP